MTTSTIVWIIIAAIVVIAIIAVIASRSRKRGVEAHRDKAAEIRQEATEHDRTLRERQAAATEAKAQSDLARADAQKRQLEAERLADEARERSGGVESVRRERDERLREADLHDPDVRTDKEGYRLDEDGNRLGDHAAGHGFDRDEQDRSGLDRRDENGSGPVGALGDSEDLDRQDGYGTPRHAGENREPGRDR
ncbi:MAG: hypothetical protein JWP82_571 [Humibacillus sp.]|nr:hypothetical protein [Humibacillus sp.]